MGKFGTFTTCQNGTSRVIIKLCNNSTIIIGIEVLKMRVTAFGAKEYDFKDEKGKARQGITVHYMCTPTSANWRGNEYGRFGFEKTSEEFNKLLEFDYPVELEIEFNRFGKVIKVLEM